MKEMRGNKSDEMQKSETRDNEKERLDKIKQAVERLKREKDERLKKEKDERLQ